MAGDRFEEQLGQGLRRLADQARPSPDARERLHRRVRREPLRRVGIIAASYAMVVAVVAVVAVAFVARTPDRDVTVPPDPGVTSATTPAPTTSSTVPQTSTTAGAAPGTTTTTPPGQAGTSTPPPRPTVPPGFADRPRAAERTPAAVPRVVRLEVGRHDDQGFDRVVLEFDGPLPGYDVRYVDRVVQDGSGEPVPLLGAADLQIRITPANAHDDTGASTLPTPRFTPGFTLVKEARLVSDFEAVVIFGVGTASRAPFRVVELSGPNRLVIDVLHPSATAAGILPLTPNG